MIYFGSSGPGSNLMIVLSEHVIHNLLDSQLTLYLGSAAILLKLYGRVNLGGTIQAISSLKKVVALQK